MGPWTISVGAEDAAKLEPGRSVIIVFVGVAAQRIAS